MKLPFTTEQFLENFSHYNEAVFPVQVLLYLIGFVTIFFSFRTKGASDRIISIMLSIFWLWMGIVYHWITFSKINKAAILFGSLFVLEAVLIFYSGVIRKKLSFRFSYDLKGTVGAFFVFFAMIIYPFLSYSMDHTYPQSPTFGLPCPTTIFTFGIFLWTFKKLPVYLLIIPLLWSLVGFSAAFTLGMFEDFGLPVASIIGTILIVVNNRKTVKAN